jgi:hypothetical protein
MRPTAEVRWFLRGSLPEAVVRWFSVAAGDRNWEERTDHYVCTAADDLGVKVREGNPAAGSGQAVEAKRRAARLAEVRFTDTAAGHVEGWRKWRFALTEDAAPDTSDWVAVRKRRSNRPFAATPDGVRPIEREEDAVQGCSLEVSALLVGESAWWSVCLEAWGEEEAMLPEVLRRVGGHVFACGTPPALPSERAMGYPAWLREVRT